MRGLLAMAALCAALLLPLCAGAVAANQRHAHMHTLRLPAWAQFVDMATHSQRRCERWVDPFSSHFKHLHRTLARHGMHTNIMVLGACDGTHDDILDYVRDKPDIAALLVEAVPHNVADLHGYLASNFTGPTTGRTEVVEAAMHPSCVEEGATMPFTYIRKSYEEDMVKRFPGKPHWIRRQLGSLAAGRTKFLKGHFNEAYVTEDFHCLSMPRLMHRYVAHQAVLNREYLSCPSVGGSPDANGRRRNRGGRLLGRVAREHVHDLHYLQMDIEGMDYDLLKDLLDNVICANCAPFPLDQSTGGRAEALSSRHLAPLIISYEQKNFLEDMDKAHKENPKDNPVSGRQAARELLQRLEQRGYRRQVCGFPTKDDGLDLSEIFMLHKGFYGG